MLVDALLKQKELETESATGQNEAQKSSCVIAKSHSANRRAKEKTCALVRVCAFGNASKTIVIAHVCPCEFSEMPKCIVFDSWPHVVHQFPVQVLLFRSKSSGITRTGAD